MCTIMVLKVNLGSEIPYDGSIRNIEKFQNEAAKLKRCIALSLIKPYILRPLLHRNHRDNQSKREGLLGIKSFHVQIRHYAYDRKLSSESHSKARSNTSSLCISNYLAEFQILYLQYIFDI